MADGDLVQDICTLIAEGRCFNKGREACHTADLLNPDIPVCHIECAVVHPKCGLQCSRSLVVEVWSIELKSKRNAGEKGLHSIFLKNAIRSHLHFSQLNSWFASSALNESNVPSCVCRFSTSPSISFIANATINHHEFPTCLTDGGNLLSITVQYVKKESLPLPGDICVPSFGSVTNDLWLLPSPVGSPSDDVYSSTPVRDYPVQNKNSIQPATLYSAVSSVGAKVRQPARRALIFPSSDKSRTGLNEDNSNVFSRGRPRAKSGSSFQTQKTSGFLMSGSPAPNGRQRSSLSASEAGFREGKRSTPSKSLLGSFEECALNGRLDPVTHLKGFTLQLAASGSFSSAHITLPVDAFFFDLNDDQPLPALGVCKLTSLGRKGYRVPKKGTIQATLFNPLGTVIKVFLAYYDVSDIPPSCQTFVRQRTDLLADGEEDRRLQHLIHLRLESDRRSRVFLHTDVRVLFSQNSSLDGLNVEIKGKVGVDSCRYKQCCETKTPDSPKYSPKK